MVTISGRLQQAALNVGKGLLAASAAAALVLGAVLPPADAEPSLHFPIARVRSWGCFAELQGALAPAVRLAY